MGSRRQPNLGGSGAHSSRRDWAQKNNPRRAIKHAPFTSVYEVDTYLSGDAIVCLECGKDCRALGNHLNSEHQMSSKEYKLKYNIPATRCLMPPDLIKKKAAIMKDAWARLPDDVSQKRREKQSQFAKEVLGPGTYVPRTKLRSNATVACVDLFDLTCRTCAKNFQNARSATKYCSQKCYHTHPDTLAMKAAQSSKAGKTRQATGVKDAQGRFVKAAPVYSHVIESNDIVET